MACTPDGHSDVFASSSRNAGASFSAPVRLNDDPTNDARDQFFPAITVDDSGTVHAMWGDDRLDTVNPGGRNYDIFGAVSTDHGATFGANTRISSKSSNPNVYPGGTFVGDYFGITACGTAVWTDTRNGNEDIYAAAPDANGDGIADRCTTTITSFTPSAAVAGTAVTINGFELGGATDASFGGVTAADRLGRADEAHREGSG